MNTYTVSIDVAALTQEAAFQAVEKVLHSRTRASDKAALMIAVPGFECFVGIRQEGLRVEQSQPELPKNCRLISVEEAVEIVKAGENGRLAVENGYVWRQHALESPELIAGTPWCAVASGGGYLVIPADSLSEYLVSLRELRESLFRSCEPEQAEACPSACSRECSSTLP